MPRSMIIVDLGSRIRTARQLVLGYARILSQPCWELWETLYHLWPRETFVYGDEGQFKCEFSQITFPISSTAGLITVLQLFNSRSLILLHQLSDCPTYFGEIVTSTRVPVNKERIADDQLFQFEKGS